MLEDAIAVVIEKSVARAAIGHHVGFGAGTGCIVHAMVIVSVSDRMFHLDTIVEQNDNIGRQIICGDSKHTHVAGVAVLIWNDQAQ